MVKPSQIRATTKYEHNNYDKVTLRLRKDEEPTRATLAKYANEKGLSLNALIIELIKKELNL